MNGVLGLVLCGGESRRMGRDKALLDLEGRSLLERAVAVISPLVDEVLLGTGDGPRYPEFGLECLLDVQAGVGPLAGLCAGLEVLDSRGAEWLVVVACDTPRLDAGLFRILLERAEVLGADACLLESEGGLQPLCAVYRRSCAGPVRDALLAGERRLRSFHGSITLGLVRECELPDSLRGRELGFNLNTPVELAEEQARLANKSDVVPGVDSDSLGAAGQASGLEETKNEDVA